MRISKNGISWFRDLEKKPLRPKTEAADWYDGLGAEVDSLRDGRLPVGDSDRHGTLLPCEAREVGRDAVVAVAENLARGLAREFNRVGHLRAVVRGRGVAVQVVGGTDLQQHAAAGGLRSVLVEVEQAVERPRRGGGRLRMGEGHRAGRGRGTGHDERLRGGFGELDGADGERAAVLLRKLRVDRRLKGDLRDGALEGNAYVGRGVYRTDRQRLHARHDEAARAQGLRGDLGEGAVVIGRGPLDEGREVRAALDRGGVEVGYGAESAGRAGDGLGQREDGRPGRQLGGGEVAADDQPTTAVESEDRERRERLLPHLGCGRRIEERAGRGIIGFGQRDRDLRALRSDGIRQNRVTVFVAGSEECGGHNHRGKKVFFHRFERID